MARIFKFSLSVLLFYVLLFNGLLFADPDVCYEEEFPLVRCVWESFPVKVIVSNPIWHEAIDEVNYYFGYDLYEEFAGDLYGQVFVKTYEVDQFKDSRVGNASYGYGDDGYCHNVNVGIRNDWVDTEHGIKTAVHELLHALGLTCHDPESGGILHSPSREAESVEEGFRNGYVFEYFDTLYHDVPVEPFVFEPVAEDPYPEDPPSDPEPIVAASCGLRR